MTEFNLRPSFSDFLTASLRGAGQVLFQENAFTGFIFLIAIFWGAFASKTPSVAFGALIGLLLSSVSAILFKFDPRHFQKGLYAYNGLLVGIAVPTFLSTHPLMWLYLIIGAVLSTLLMEALARGLKRWTLSPLTFPFVLISWFALVAAGFASPAETTAVTEIHWLQGTLKGVSQVFLIDNNISGLLFLLGLALSSWRAALWALIGSFAGLWLASLFGLNVSSGLFGYSPVITAMAIGSVFFEASLKIIFYTFFGILLTVGLQIILNTALAKINLPSLTAPFVFATWILLVFAFFINSKKE